MVGMGNFLLRIEDVIRLVDGTGVVLLGAHIGETVTGCNMEGSAVACCKGTLGDILLDSVQFFRAGFAILQLEEHGESHR